MAAHVAPLQDCAAPEPKTVLKSTRLSVVVLTRIELLVDSQTAPR